MKPVASQTTSHSKPSVSGEFGGNPGSTGFGFHGLSFPARRSIVLKKVSHSETPGTFKPQNPVQLLQVVPNDDAAPRSPIVLGNPEEVESEIPPSPSRDLPPGRESPPEPMPRESESLKSIPPEPEPTPAREMVRPPVTIGAPSGVDLSAFAPPNLPANCDPDVLPWTASFEERVNRVPAVESFQLPPEAIAKLPPDFHPWWTEFLAQPIFPGCTTLPVSVDLLTVGALQYSPKVLAIKTEPNIRQTFLFEERSEFDWRAFVETRWQDLNEPVGNTLTTGGPSRLKNDQWNGNASLKRRNSLGGEFEISQRIGYEDQNSIYFLPGQQGNSRLLLGYTQPLLNGRGRAYNESRIVLACIELNRSFDEVAQELQEHLFLVVEAYWELYRARAVYLQRQRVLGTGEKILVMLAGREDVDAQQRQVLRAQAAVASRKTDIIRAAAAVKNAESRLRLLVNDPRLLELGAIELIPNELPRCEYLPLSMSDSLRTALINRSDISQSLRTLRAIGVRLGVAENEMLPRLDLVLQAYTNGLAGHGDIASAIGKQSSEGRPTYSVGFEFEYPLGNHAAKARLSRRELELHQASYEFRTVVETALTEVEIAVREAETTYREVLSNYQAFVAAQTEASFLEDRWRWLPGQDRDTTLLLENLLDAQERLALAEADLVASQSAYTVALARVQKMMGTLLRPEAACGFLPSTESPQPLPQEVEPVRVEEIRNASLDM